MKMPMRSGLSLLSVYNSATEATAIGSSEMYPNQTLDTVVHESSQRSRRSSKAKPISLTVTIKIYPLKQRRKDRGRGL